MKKDKKLTRGFYVFLVLWLLSLSMLIRSFSIYRNKAGSIVNEETFAANVEFIQKEDKVGANIWLKQAIHGTDGIKYRYVVETDCPSWDFETRYMTDTPISWIDETSAVEVLIYDVQIRYDGTAYAGGQYYTVPILGNLSSETVSLDKWKANLTTQAYQAYVADKKNYTDGMRLLLILVIGLPVIGAIWSSCNKHLDKMLKEHYKE